MEQQNLLVECEPLPDLTGTTGEHVLSTMTEWGVMYTECQARHQLLVEAVK